MNIFWSAGGCSEKIGKKILRLLYIFPLVEIFGSSSCCPVAVKCRAWAGDRFDMFIVLMDLMDCWRE